MKNIGLRTTCLPSPDPTISRRAPHFTNSTSFCFISIQTEIRQSARGPIDVITKCEIICGLLPNANVPLRFGDSSLSPLSAKAAELAQSAVQFSHRSAGDFRRIEQVEQCLVEGPLRADGPVEQRLELGQPFFQQAGRAPFQMLQLSGRMFEGVGQAFDQAEQPALERRQGLLGWQVR